MSCFDYRWLLRVPARGSGLRTGVLFCLLSFDAKTSFTVVIVVKDHLLGLLCRIFTQILGRFAMFYQSLIHSRWLHDRSSFLWNLGNVGFPKQFFLNAQNWLKLFQQVKPPLYANFVSNSTKVTLGKKSRAPPYLFWSFELFWSFVFLTRDARWWSTPRTRKLVRATLNGVIISHHLQAQNKTLKTNSSAVCTFLEARLSDEGEVPKEKKSCSAKNRVDGIGNKYRERGKCKYQFHLRTSDSCCYKRRTRQHDRCAKSRG